MDTGLVCLAHISLLCLPAHMRLCWLSSPPPLQHVYNDVILLWWCYHSDSTPSHLIIWRERHSRRRRHHSCLIDGIGVQPNVLCGGKGSPFAPMGVFRWGKITAKQRDLKINVQRLSVREMNGKYVMSCPPAQGGCDFYFSAFIKIQRFELCIVFPSG